MYYTYILQSEKDKSFYIGYTKDLRKRLKEHNQGKTFTTRKMLPIELIYYEAYKSEIDAMNREKQLKIHGKAFGQLKRRILNSIMNSER